jgi:hypothetical protein
VKRAPLAGPHGATDWHVYVDWTRDELVFRVAGVDAPGNEIEAASLGVLNPLRKRVGL